MRWARWDAQRSQLPDRLGCRFLPHQLEQLKGKIMQLKGLKYGRQAKNQRLKQRPQCFLRHQTLFADFAAFSVEINPRSIRDGRYAAET